MKNILDVFKKTEEVHCEKFGIVKGLTITPNLAGKIHRMCKENTDLKEKESRLNDEIWSLKCRVAEMPVTKKHKPNELILAKQENSSLYFKLGIIEDKHKQRIKDIQRKQKERISDLNKRNKYNMTLMHKTLKRLLPEDMSVPDYIKLTLKDWRH